MKKLKTLISSRASIFNSDGTSVRARRILNALKDLNEVYLITRSNEEKKIPELEKDHLFIIKPEKSKLWNLKIIPHIIKHEFDLVICENDWHGFPIYWIFSKFRKMKIIFEVHGIISEEITETKDSHLRFKLYQFIERFCIKKADIVIALSENIYEYCIKYNNKTRLIPVFVKNIMIDQEIIDNAKKFRENKLIGIIGPFDEIRNKYALEFIIKNIDKFDSKINFNIIGKYEEKTISPRLNYLGYIDSFKEYSQSIAELDAVLVIEAMSTSGPLNKILEPMAYSIPVFTTPKGVKGIKFIESNVNIIISDEEEIVSKVNELIFDVDLMNEVGKNAKATFKENYSIETNYKRLLEIIEEI